MPQSRTRLSSQKRGEDTPSRAQAMHTSLGSARSPGPRPVVRPRASSPHPPAPGPLPPPPRPATTLTFSARAVKGGLPDITSARRHLLQLSQLSRSRPAPPPSPRPEAEGRRSGEGRSAKRATLPRKPTAAYSQPAAITSTKWRRREGSRRFDHHPPTKGARSGRPRLLVAGRRRPALAGSDWQAYATSPLSQRTLASREKE